jgi:CO dehydrogenase maturation factor
LKVAVCGKGGSGKSTVTALLSMELRGRGYRPLIIDADESNSTLYRLLGIEVPPEPLVKLAGGRQMVRQLMPPGYTPKALGEGTNILTQASISLGEIPQTNIAEAHNIRLIIVGKITEPLEGCACPMGVLSREFIGKLQLQNDEIVIADMEAGIEHFGRGIGTSLDSVLMVVEPSFESISLAGRMVHLASGMGIKHFWAILNKINSEAVAAKITAELTEKDVMVIGSLPFDEKVFSAGLEGIKLTIGSDKLSGALIKIADYILY